ncbi:MAG: flagellar brake protein [Burkholderiales bacterium]|nr:flagellar brake protein [Burkholderiales bacterium]
MPHGASSSATGAPERPDWAAFRVEHPQEIVRLLGALRESAAPVLLSGPRGDSASCTLRTIDAGRRRIGFRTEPESPSLQVLVDDDEVVALAHLEQVRLQFELHGLLLVQDERHCALESALPERVYRFQRRSAYRVQPPQRHAPTARMRHPSIPEMQLALRVLDISAGGCALLLPEGVPALEPGGRLNEVQVVLDSQTRFVAGLQIRYLSALQGNDRMRLGCQWVALRADARLALQRYVDQTQKCQRLLSS